jgi:hypothetical protein
LLVDGREISGTLVPIPGADVTEVEVTVRLPSGRE